MQYTQIQARVTGQRMEMVNVPTLIAGSIEVYQIKASFCSRWDGMAKTAVFSRKDADPIPRLMVDDAVIVPPEVLEEDGFVFFGIFGTLDTQTLPTETWQLTVQKGTITAAAVDFEDPTPDIYSQILAEANAAKNIAQGVRDEFDSGVVPALLDQNSVKGVRIWAGTMEEYEAAKDDLPQGCLVIITNDTTIADLKAQVEQLQDDVDALKSGA